MTTAAGKPPRRRHRESGHQPALPLTSHVVPTALLARVVALSEDGTVLVALAGQTPVAALVLHQISAEQLHHAKVMATPVLVVALDGDVRRLAIIGVMTSTVTPHRLATAKVDGRRVEITGQDEVVLACGAASITLTKAGKVIIKGVRISSLAEEVQRITGGSVQIN